MSWGAFDSAPWRLAVDSGLLVLIWMVQIIVYPSFLYADPERLVRWHGLYTGRISMVVMPLMLAQVAIVAYQVTAQPSATHLASAALIAGCWASTFLLSVPLHGRIASGDIDPEVLQALVTTNWPRTVGWTLTFLLAARPWMRVAST